MFENKNLLIWMLIAEELTTEKVTGKLPVNRYETLLEETARQRYIQLCTIYFCEEVQIMEVQCSPDR